MQQQNLREEKELPGVHRKGMILVRLFPRAQNRQADERQCHIEHSDADKCCQWVAHLSFSGRLGVLNLNVYFKTQRMQHRKIFDWILAFPYMKSLIKRTFIYA